MLTFADLWWCKMAWLKNTGFSWLKTRKVTRLIQAAWQLAELPLRVFFKGLEKPSKPRFFLHLHGPRAIAQGPVKPRLSRKRNNKNLSLTPAPPREKEHFLIHMLTPKKCGSHLEHLATGAWPLSFRLFPSLFQLLSNLGRNPRNLRQLLQEACHGVVGHWFQ